MRRCPVENCPARIYACDNPETIRGNLTELDIEIERKLPEIVNARDANKGVCFFEETTTEQTDPPISKELGVILCLSLQFVGMSINHFGGQSEAWRLLYQPADAGANTINDLDQYLKRKNNLS